MPINFVPIEFGEANPSNLVIEDITTGTLDGTGVFDIFMQAISVHLQNEYDKNRITGKEYATVYLGAMAAALQQAVAAQQVRAEVGLIRQKTVTELANTSNVLPLGLGFNVTNEIEGLMWHQIAKSEAEVVYLNNQVAHLAKQIDKMQSEIVLLNAKTLTENEQIGDDGLIERQRALYKAQTEGFARDAEQKLAKIVVDSWAVRRTTDDGTLTPSSLTDSAINSILGIAKAGIE